MNSCSKIVKSYIFCLVNVKKCQNILQMSLHFSELILSLGKNVQKHPIYLQHPHKRCSFARHMSTGLSKQ